MKRRLRRAGISDKKERIKKRKRESERERENKRSVRDFSKWIYRKEEKKRKKKKNKRICAGEEKRATRRNRPVRIMLMKGDEIGVKENRRKKEDRKRNVRRREQGEGKEREIEVRKKRSSHVMGVYFVQGLPWWIGESSIIGNRFIG